MVGLSKVGEIGSKINWAAERFSRGTWRRRIGYLYEKNLRQSAVPPETPALPPGLSVHQVSPTEFGRVAKIGGQSPEELGRWHDSGAICLGVSVDNYLASVTWIQFGPLFVRGVGLLLELETDDCYEYGAVTDPAYRGRGLYSLGRQESLHLLAARGIRRSTAIVMEGNRIPDRRLLETGFQKTMRIDCIGLGQWRRAVLTDLRDGTKTVQTHYGVPPDVTWI